MRIVLIFCFSVILRAGEETWIDQYIDEAGAMNKACAAKDYKPCREHLLALEKLLDGRVDIVYRLAKVEANLGNRDAALARLTVFAKSGLTFADPAAEPAFESLKGDAGFQGLIAKTKSAREPISRCKLFVTLSQADLIAEDIAYDALSGTFYVSGVRHSKIISIDRNGATADFVREGQPNVWSILALGVDSKLRVLWAATAALPESVAYRKADEGRSALLKYSLDNGELLKRYDLAKDRKHALGDMTLSAAGDVFVSDGESGAIYWVDHRKDELQVLIDRGVFHSPQTPALSSDGRVLLIPDYSRGISRVDLSTKQVHLLEHPQELSLGGIDGMYLAGRTLVAIQNGTVPERIIRMKLDESLERVIDWETLEANWIGLGDPTHGVFVGDDFYFIANSGWDRMADDGGLKPGAKFEPATIRHLQLDAR